MKKHGLFLVLLLLTVVVLACKWGPFDRNTATPTTNSSPTPTPTPIGDITGGPAATKTAYRITGNIDDAQQEGNVCDTTKPFTVPGTLKFEFKPTGPTKGEYTYSGPLNATGSGPYEIKPDGTMIVDGTGCIMGRCATYSHNWKAVPIDPATCKEGK
jgi:hypothetical protein